ncbi:UNVERIFIED_CONTAM: hypothetical protein Sradi_3298700 [Sesamum radiatum]|uniref:Uncharacterized protein n=1 Tax=Sesamum radiatum TaxID=300843 RepID=A0AAW2R0X1_SESRA
MMNSDNGDDNRSYHRNSYLSALVGPTIPLAVPTSRATNPPVLDPTLGVANAPAPTLDQTVGPVAMNLLFMSSFVNSSWRL